MDPALALEVAAMSQLKAIDEATERGDSEIQRFYSGAVVLVTGGSGFIGKQLIEKLFRSCEIAKLYILIRSKKGQSIHQRLSEILQDSVYEQLRLKQPSFADRIVAVEGDVAELRLGISDENWKTITEEVTIIFHMAATTRFNESLRVATLINVRGIREAIALGKACKNLRSYVYVSTAYSNASSKLVGSNVLEEFYPSPILPDAMIQIAETMDETRLKDITSNLTKDWPNTYTFTKAIAEEVVRNMSDGLPICVVRPAIVVGCYREPCPGWIDKSNVYGATGIVLGVGLGVSHVIYGDLKTKLNFVPCDFVNNVNIAAGWLNAVKDDNAEKKTKIYCVSISMKNHITIGGFNSLFENECSKYPSPKAVWHGFALNTKMKLMFLLLSWFYHFIPGYIIDGICFAIGKERRFVKLYKKIYELSLIESYFVLNDWNFIDDNVDVLRRNMSVVDRQIFNVDVKSINWKEYILIWVIGIRKHIVKDGLEGTKLAIKKKFWLRILHYIVFALYLFGIWNIMYFCFRLLSYLISYLSY